MNLRTCSVNYLAFLDKHAKGVNISFGIAFTVLIGFLDYYLDTITKADFTLAFFYLIPISFIAWLVGRNAGISVSLLAAVIKMLAAPNSYYSIYLSIWTNSTSFAFFLVVALLIAKMRQLLDHERALSRTDHLTDVANTRAFLETLTSEVFRHRRHYRPFGLAYIDIDNFKEINDNFGHAKGDAVLKTVAATISRNLRRTDMVARLGGDEFAILFPDTDEAAGSAAVGKIREQLNISMQQYNIRVTFSIGLITCHEPPESADEVITLADNLMYEVKKTGKDSVRHAVYEKKGKVKVCQELA